jgi:hypothetical protein
MNPKRRQGIEVLNITSHSELKREVNEFLKTNPGIHINKMYATPIGNSGYVWFWIWYEIVEDHVWTAENKPIEPEPPKPQLDERLSKFSDEELRKELFERMKNMLGSGALGLERMLGGLLDASRKEPSHI